jgi:hypothetical protein
MTDSRGENAHQPAAPRQPQHAQGYVWKLCLTCAFLIFWFVLSVSGLAALAYYQKIFSAQQPWALSALVAGLGGLLGGLARALYYFSFDSYAFNHRLQTNVSSVWARSICDTLDDQFDPLWVWYLWCLKPAVGAMVGMIAALSIELGVISLGAGEAAKGDLNLRLLVLGGIGGFFSERAFESFRKKS